MDNMNLSGQLSDWTMHDLLQIMQVTKKTGSLDITGTHKGRVHFNNGNVTAAELHSQKGVYAGTDQAIITDIIFVLGAMETGAFSVGKADGPDLDGLSIDSVSEGIEALRKIEAEAGEAGLTTAKDIKLKSDLSKPITFTEEDWSVVAALVPAFSFEALEDRLGRGTAIRIVHAFHRLELVDYQEVEDDDEGLSHDDLIEGSESDWLDQLAEEVTARDQEGDSEPLLLQPIDPPKKGHVEGVHATGVSADASTVLTGGVYDEIRRLRSKVGE